MAQGQPSVPAGLELPARAASGAILIIAAVAGLIAGGVIYAAIVALVAAAGLFEWHRLVNGGHIALEMLPSAAAIAALAWSVQLLGGVSLASMAILAGTHGSALVAALRRRPGGIVLWHGAAAVYLGIPTLAFLVLRNLPHGAVLVGAVFVAVWLADTAALLGGRAIGGPKLAPRLSPNKTWAGFAVGTLAAGLGEAVYAGALGGHVAEGLLLGLALALSGHAGDLFESWVKRHFHAKNSGNLIPGHGGVLDRIDSLLFAVPVCAVLIVFAGFNPFAGA